MVKLKNYYKMSELVQIRFYAELNELLKNSDNEIYKEAEIKPGQTVKDLIEALGVPHTEIAIIMVNSKAVDFSYQMKNNDHISVYPHFYSLDIQEVNPLDNFNIEEYKFIADVHLGRLVKYLRLLGFDCLYENDYEDLQIIDIGTKQNRIILTRDLGILKFAKVKLGYLIKSHEPEEQTKEVLRRYELKNRIQPFTRCLECNTLTHPVEKEKVIDRLEPKTKKYFNEFRICPGCERIYWKGSHFERINELLDSFT